MYFKPQGTIHSFFKNGENNNTKDGFRFFLQDNSVNAHSCRELGRQQVLAGRRQGQELDLLGSFPSESGSFQHPPLPSTHPPNSTGTDRERETKGYGVREQGKREVNREEGCKERKVKREADMQRHAGCREEDRALLEDHYM